MTASEQHDSRTERATLPDAPLHSDQIEAAVAHVLATTQFIDIHTHLFSPAFGKLGLWGIDELLTYHYLEAEFFRSADLSPEQYWSLSQAERADAIWRVLFVDNDPVSEATRGVIAVLHAFGLPTNSPNLDDARVFFHAQNPESHTAKVLEMAGIDQVVMTNDPLDPAEKKVWMQGLASDPIFQSALRLDGLLNSWSESCQKLSADGYAVDADLSPQTVSEIRRFLHDWHQKMSPAYWAVSLPDTFQFPEDSARGLILQQAVLPACRELGVPLSLMIGVRRQINPRLRLAGDGVGRADLRSLEHLCRDFPDNRFLVSVLSRENQHELCIYARKFSNLMLFGCWWFLNNPSIVEEITRERIEMLGSSFIPQHSDARVLEQLIYKWQNTRAVMGKTLSEKYRMLQNDGRAVSENDIQRTVTRLFRTNFQQMKSPK